MTYPLLRKQSARLAPIHPFTRSPVQPVVWLACLLSLAALPGHAARDPFTEDVLAVRARRIETAIRGTIENGVIVIRRGKITAVGADAKIPPDAKLIEADTVMPGIVGVSRIGLSAQWTPPTPNPAAPTAASNPHYRVVDELYPFDGNYRRLLRLGVTTLGLMPGGLGICGQGAAVKPAGATPEEMLLAPSAFLMVGFAALTQTQDVIRGAFGSIKGEKPAAAPPAPGTPAPPAAPPAPTPPAQPPSTVPDASGVFPAARQEPLAKAVQGDTPLLVQCSDPASVAHALQLLQPYEKMKPVYLVSGDCYRAAEILGGNKASVVVAAALVNEPSSRNVVNAVAVLAKAGAKVACRPRRDDTPGFEALRADVGDLVNAGLDRATALRAITLHPAEMLGLGARVGSIEVGRDGNLLLLNGDPFSRLTRVTGVILEGEVVP